MDLALVVNCGDGKHMNGLTEGRKASTHTHGQEVAKEMKLLILFCQVDQHATETEVKES